MTGATHFRPEAAALLEEPGLARILAILDRDGEETRLVGGALRNALLGRPVHEFDLATTALPEVTMVRAAEAGLRAIPTGIEHGTVTVLVGHQPFEVTSLREDIETDGRRAKVLFGRDFAADARRRDFTMNALSMTREGKLFDYVGGLADIEARKIRFIGEPAQRITEDYLRILRFFRFSADFAEGPLDAAGLMAAMQNREGLDRLSRERVRAELLKLFCARRAAEVTSEISNAGLLGPLLGAAPNPARLQKLVAISGNAPADPILRLAALCVYMAEDAQRLREKLRLSNEEFQRLERVAKSLVPLHGSESPPQPQDLKALLFHRGRQTALDAIMLAQAEACPSHDGQWETARIFLRDTPEPRLPFSGADVMARGVANGRAIGEALKDLQVRWIDAGFPEDPASLAHLLAEVGRPK